MYKKKQNSIRQNSQKNVSNVNPNLRLYTYLIRGEFFQLIIIGKRFEGQSGITII